MRHYFLIGPGVGNDLRTNIGAKIDPMTCLTLVFLGPVSKVKVFIILMLKSIEL